jgi:hypothetical protein
MRASISMLLYLAVPGVAIVAACGTPDPTQLQRVGYGDSNLDPDAAPVDGSSVSDAAPGEGGHDAGLFGDATPTEDAIAHDAALTETTEGGADGAIAADAAPMIDAAPPPINAFTGDTTGYVATAGTPTDNAAHNFPGNTPVTNPAGQPCLTCHIAGGAGVPFMFAGTVWTTAAATAPAAEVEVRLRDNAGIGTSTYTDAFGNYFVLLGAAATFSPPAHPGIRTATTTDLMTGAIDNGNCNDCHRAGGQTPIHLQ